MLYIVQIVAVLYFTSLDSLAHCFGFSVPSTSPLPTPIPIRIFVSFQIWILCQNSLTRQIKIGVVGFALKKLVTHFEMLIVSHAVRCVNGHYFCILPLLTVFYTILVPVLDNHVSDEQLMSIRHLKE